MSTAELIPVVVFGFNRPDKLKRILDALRPQRVDRLVIFVDGPRGAMDLPGVEACRALARQVDWAPTDLHLWETNHGFPGLITNPDLAAQDYPWFVVVEDDCLPMPGFYDFMRQALTRYEKQPQVFSICGYQPLPPSMFKQHRLAVVGTARFSCWGWATWRERWQEIRPYLDQFESLFDHYRQAPTVAGPETWLIGDSIAAGAPMDVWDYRVMAAALALKKIHIQPARGLVRNVGLSGGFHGSWGGRLRDLVFQNRNVAERLPADLPWPDVIQLDCWHVDGWIEQVYRSRALTPRRMLNRWTVWRRNLGRRERLSGLDLLPLPAKELPHRALLAYATAPFRIAPDDLRFYQHNEIALAQSLVRALNRLGYLVDVIDQRDQEFVPGSGYDVFVGPQSAQRGPVAGGLPAATHRMYLAPFQPGDQPGQAEADRRQALKERHGVDLPPQPVLGERAGLRRLAEGLLAFGDPQAQAGAVEPFTLYDDHFDWCAKDYQAGRQRFLFFSRSGGVCEGLDLLLEAFTGLDQHLYIYAPVDAALARAYRKELGCPNIHLFPHLQLRSGAYYRLLEQINFCMLPACGPGQVQAVVEAMNQGLIPLVSREAGLPVEPYGVTLPDLSISGLRSEIQRLAGWDEAECRARSRQARQAAITRFSQGRFEANLQHALEQLLPIDRDWAGERPA